MPGLLGDAEIKRVPRGSLDSYAASRLVDLEARKQRHISLSMIFSILYVVPTSLLRLVMAEHL
jgi:hypothetical protein